MPLAKEFIFPELVAIRVSFIASSKKAISIYIHYMNPGFDSLSRMAILYYIVSPHNETQREIERETEMEIEMEMGRERERNRDGHGAGVRDDGNGERERESDRGRERQRCLKYNVT